MSDTNETRTEPLRTTERPAAPKPDLDRTFGGKSSPRALSDHLRRQDEGLPFRDFGGKSSPSALTAHLRGQGRA